MIDKSYQIQETQKEVFGRARWRCENCGMRLSHPNSNSQLAHRIKKSKANIKKYGKEIIHHPLNMKAVCGLECNAVFDLGHNEYAIEKLVSEIIREINK